MVGQELVEYFFPRYLLSKQSVDDRALNRTVLDSLKANLPTTPICIIEVGAGIGTMLWRLLRWNVVAKAVYVVVDEMAENIETAQEWIPCWAEDAGMNVERIAHDQLRVFDQAHDFQIRFEQTDVFDFIQKKPLPADLLIAHAFLDLLPLPESLLTGSRCTCASRGRLRLGGACYQWKVSCRGGLLLTFHFELYGRVTNRSC